MHEQWLNIHRNSHLHGRNILNVLQIRKIKYILVVIRVAYRIFHSYLHLHKTEQSLIDYSRHARHTIFKANSKVFIISISLKTRSIDWFLTPKVCLLLSSHVLYSLESMTSARCVAKCCKTLTGHNTLINMFTFKIILLRFLM